MKGSAVKRLTKGLRPLWFPNPPTLNNNNVPEGVCSEKMTVDITNLRLTYPDLGPSREVTTYIVQGRTWEQPITYRLLFDKDINNL